MWGQILGLLGSVLGGGQEEGQDPMAGYQARMMQGVGPPPQYPDVGGGMGGGAPQQQGGGMFNQAPGVNSEYWKMMQDLARKLGGGGGMGGGFGGGGGGMGGGGTMGGGY